MIFKLKCKFQYIYLTYIYRVVEINQQGLMVNQHEKFVQLIEELHHKRN
jgi:hypothetical protein